MVRKILVVDDEPSLLDALQYSFQREGFQVTGARDGSEALRSVEKEAPDLMILDLMLPGMDGLEVLRRLRARRCSIPVILLTAKDEVIDRVVGLEVGADDYVTKPFSPRELVARVKAHFRRQEYLEMGGSKGGDQAPKILSFPGLEINVAKREVRKGEKPIPLTHREFELLFVLASHVNQVLSREILLNKAWGYDFLGDAAIVKSTIQRLREKVEEDPGHPKFIATVRGVGYMFVIPANS